MLAPTLTVTMQHLQSALAKRRARMAATMSRRTRIQFVAIAQLREQGEFVAAEPTGQIAGGGDDC